jgi:uncharacterized protein YwgA
MSNDLAVRVANVVRDAGGRVVGRTKLQKMIYLLVASGLEENVPFVYKHYGPFSEQAADAARSASLLGHLTEKEEVSSWGGGYSVYTVEQAFSDDSPRHALLGLGVNANSVELELAATALFLFKEEKSSSPWQETARRKPEKAAHGRLESAKLLYGHLRSIQTPVPLPELQN